MKSLNLNYLRGLYGFLLDKSDEDLEDFDVNLPANRKILLEEMKRSFSRFGPIAKRNVIDGLRFLMINFADDLLWRNAIPHDLLINQVAAREAYLKEVWDVLMKCNLPSMDFEDLVLIDEIGPSGLDFSR
ncbi:hypothetical protein ABL840_25395 [Variovorax sp. NFACC27]|uniref:hypothetical protein n=1 Tax=unclassified Variovorax TaxID=663243 RepID=UPI00115F9D7C